MLLLFSRAVLCLLLALLLSPRVLPSLWVQLWLPSVTGRSKGSAGVYKSPAQSVGAAMAPKSPKQSVGEAKLQTGGIVPGSGTGDKVPVKPQGSFVLNKKATNTIHKLQTGGIASLGGQTVNAIEERFFTANETYSETMKQKKKRPVVVVDIPDQQTAPPSPHLLQKQWKPVAMAV